MPNIAMAGIGEKEAKEQNIEVFVDRYDFSVEAKSQIENEDFGYLKFVVEKSSKRVIGITIVHDEANTIAGEAALIVGRKLTLKEIIDTIHPHPTMAESFVALAKQMMGEIMIKKLKNPVIEALIKLERLI
jgi:dihydrolipoamide dehydrogenase